MPQQTMLAFHFEGARRSALTAACMRHKIRLVWSDGGENETIAALLGMLPRNEEDVPSAPLAQEMIVMAGLDGTQLQAFLRSWRQLGGAPIRLKAMVTPTNVQWTARALQEELIREDESMRAGAPQVHDAQKPD